MLIQKNELFGLFDKEVSKEVVQKTLSSLPKSITVSDHTFNIEWGEKNKGKIFGSADIRPKDSKTKTDFRITLSFYIPLTSKKFSLILNVYTDPRQYQKIFGVKDKTLIKGESYSSPSDLASKVRHSISEELKGMYKQILGNKMILEQRKYRVEKEEEGVIRKVGNKWRILKKNRKDYWDAVYDTRSDAEAALRAYWANKREARLYKTRKEGGKYKSLEFFNTMDGKSFVKNLVHYLMLIFGPTIYFDHITDNKANLYYKGNEIAELLYNDKTEEVVIMPEDDSIPPIAFYDTSEYEIKDYLSDLLLGDLDTSKNDMEYM